MKTRTIDPQSRKIAVESALICFKATRNSTYITLAVRCVSRQAKPANDKIGRNFKIDNVRLGDMLQSGADLTERDYKNFLRFCFTEGLQLNHYGLTY
jgi:hypothetical protein